MSNLVRPHRQQPTRLLCPCHSPGKNTRVGCHFLLLCVNQFSSVQFSHSVVSDSLRPRKLQHARPPCLPGASKGDPTHGKGHKEEPWWAKAGQDSRDSSTPPMTRSCRWGGSRLKISPRSAWPSTPKTKICVLYYTFLTLTGALSDHLSLEN